MQSNKCHIINWIGVFFVWVLLLLWHIEGQEINFAQKLPIRVNYFFLLLCHTNFSASRLFAREMGHEICRYNYLNIHSYIFIIGINDEMMNLHILFDKANYAIHLSGIRKTCMWMHRNCLVSIYHIECVWSMRIRWTNDMEVYTVLIRCAITCNNGKL